MGEQMLARRVDNKRPYVQLKRADLMPPHLYWGLVQLAEHQILTLEVKGSSPLPPAIK